MGVSQVVFLQLHAARDATKCDEEISSNAIMINTPIAGVCDSF